MKINVPHVAKLANLLLKDEEIVKFEKHLSEVIEYVGKLDEVSTENVNETSQVTGLENILREDTTKPSLSQNDALSNAVNKHNEMFVVKGILENE